MSGGGPNECYRFTLTRGDRSESLVLRIKVPGAICPTEAEREFQAMTAAQAVLPVPDPYWLTLDVADFGLRRSSAPSYPG